MVYLFIGQDNISKDIQLKRLKEEHLLRNLIHFNLDTLYAKETTLKDLQEKLLFLPLNCPKRIIVIKGAQDLKEEIKEFILKYVKKPLPKIILVLDIDHYDNKDEFINHIYRYARTIRFKETLEVNTFTLSRQIELKKPDYALRILSQLLRNGERPERILGGLRYAWERDVGHPQDMRRRLKLLLNCDIDIKTGRLKPSFALEKLVIKLCGLTKPFH